MGPRALMGLMGRFAPPIPPRLALAAAPCSCDPRLMDSTSKREFSVIVERDADGYYIATVPGLRGCHTQARSLDQLQERIREAIELCLESEGERLPACEFIGVQRVAL